MQVATFVKLQGEKKEVVQNSPQRRGSSVTEVKEEVTCSGWAKKRRVGEAGPGPLLSQSGGNVLVTYLGELGIAGDHMLGTIWHMTKYLSAVNF